MITVEEKAHCSNHTYFSNGCGDCAVSYLYQIESERDPYFEKAVVTHIHPLVIQPGHPSPKLQLIRQQMTRKIFIFLTNAKQDVIKAIKKEAKRFDKDIVQDRDFLFEAAFSAILWDDLTDEIMPDLVAACDIGASDGYNQLNLKKEHLDDIDNIASTYATYRSAEIIGKKWSKGDSGNLIDNPNAKYVISDTTKDDMKDTIDKAADDKSSFLVLESLLVASGIFSLARAQLIAKTEIAMAQAAAHLKAWRSTGLVESAKIVLSNTHVGIDECNEAAEKSPYSLENLPFVPLHPNCQCSVEATEVDQ